LACNAVRSARGRATFCWLSMLFVFPTAWLPVSRVLIFVRPIFYSVCVCVWCAYWKQCLSVEARWRRVCVASPSVMALSPRVQGVAAVIDNCGFVVFRLRHKPGCVVVAFTFSFFSIVAVLLFDVWRVDVMWFVGSCCCCAANKEVIYSMLEGAQPVQATARTVAGGRPSYHSNCGRVARSVWKFPPSDFQE